ncbi:MAG: ATP-NAD kinase family protein [Ferrimonas sp.]
MRRFKLGLLINPYAGLGGSLALKGSDGVAALALAQGGHPQANARMRQALTQLLPESTRLTLYCAAGAMGAQLAHGMGFHTHICYEPRSPQTSAEDTHMVAQALCQQGVDLLLFAGGDGTARDLLRAIGSHQPVIGVPAGVKMHSSVYAITPTAAGLIAAQMLQGELLSLTNGEVRDIDETQLRQGTVRSRYFGEMSVPISLQFMQAVKQGGRESEPLVIADIAADVVESMCPETLYMMGAGTTVAAVMAELLLPNTLLGVDLVLNGQQIGQDLNASQLLAAWQQHHAKQQPCKLLISPIGGQGHLFGRGNQQFSPELLRAVGRESIQVLATKSKLTALGGRPLLCDCGDPELDHTFAGYYRIITGYHDAVLYPLANPELGVTL